MIGKRKKLAQAGAAGGLAAAVLTAGLVTTPHAHADIIDDIPWSKVGTALEIANAVHAEYDLCTANWKNGLPCGQSTARTVADTYGALQGFIAQYNADRERTAASLDQIIKNQKDAAVKAEAEQVQADLNTTYVGMNIYDSFLDCFNQNANGGENATCEAVDQFGASRGQVPATPAQVKQEADLLVAVTKNKPTDRSAGFGLTVSDFMQRIGGKSTNPYKGTGLLHAVMDQRETVEGQRQGLLAGHHLQFFPADYVNGLGLSINEIVKEEEAYFTVRIAAVGLDSSLSPEQRTTDAGDLLHIAEHGDGKRVLSLEQQYDTYTFPNWNPDNQLRANQSYYRGPNSGVHLLTADGNTTFPLNGSVPEAPTGGDAPGRVTFNQLPTEDELESLAKDMATDPSGATYQKLSKVNPVDLPPLKSTPNQEPATGRLWSKPREVFVGKTRPTRFVNSFETLWGQDGRGKEYRYPDTLTWLPVRSLQKPHSDPRISEGSYLRQPVAVDFFANPDYIAEMNKKSTRKMHSYGASKYPDFDYSWPTVNTQYSAPVFDHWSHYWSKHSGWGSWLTTNPDVPAGVLVMKEEPAGGLLQKA